MIAYVVAYRICLGLQHRERQLIEHGVETGTIKLLPSGAYEEVTRPSTEEELAPITVPRPPVAVAIERPEVDGVESPEARRPLGRLRMALHGRFTPISDPL